MYFDSYQELEWLLELVWLLELYFIKRNHVNSNERRMNSIRIDFNLREMTGFNGATVAAGAASLASTTAASVPDA